MWKREESCGLLNCDLHDSWGRRGCFEREVSIDQEFWCRRSGLNRRPLSYVPCIDIARFLFPMPILNQFSSALPIWRWEKRRLPRFLTHHDMLVAIGALTVPPSASCHQPLRVKSRFTPHPGGVRVPKDVKRAALREIDASFECGSLEKAVEMAGFSEPKNSSR
jgi:hypothetical protein